VPNQFPEMPPPINLDDLRGEPRIPSWYLTTPTGLIRFLETNTDTKLLARPQIQGTHGAQMTLRLGSDIPVPTTTFQSSGTGGIANVPTTSFTYRPVGINLQFTPRVSLDGDVILEKAPPWPRPAPSNPELAASQRTEAGMEGLPPRDSSRIARVCP
jgi:type II secretory pathway component GspD/PulD (secretin)